MQIDIAQTPVPEIYQLLVGIVTPRPIAWVTTVDEAGRVNLAPFSFYNAFGANPPVVVFSPTLRRNSTKKDTLLNIEKSGEFVINAATDALVEQVNESSRELPPGTSELDHVGLTAVASLKVRPPRVAQSPANFECRLIQIVPIGTGPIASNLVIGEILMMHIDDQILDEKNAIDPKKLKTVARLGGDFWCHSSDLFKMKRP